MSRVKAKKLAEYMGFEAPTMAEAKEKAAAALEACYTPRIVRWRNWTVVVAREPRCWTSFLIAPDDSENPGDRKYGCMHASEAEALRSARAHVAQCAARLEDRVGPSFLDADQAEDFRRYQRWQRAAFYAKHVLGLDVNGCHKWACENETTFPL